MPAQLDRRRVVTGAIGYIDRHGVETLTMRRLGSALGVEAMALYRHVDGRGPLLDAVVERLIDDLFQDPRMREDPQSWEDYLQRVANAIRDLALAHPKAFPLIATTPPEFPWIRPPLRSLRWVDHFLNSLKGYGFADADAVGAYKAFTSFLLGYLMLEAAAQSTALTMGPAPDDTATVEENTSSRLLEAYPAVDTMQHLLTQDHAAREFNDALDELIERLRSSVS